MTRLHSFDTCEECGKEYRVNRRAQRFCTKACRELWWLKERQIAVEERRERREAAE
jgi:hydrogenase maturation factor HypF (carbamoyltransferase family)